MYRNTKVATCCYCGTRAALVLDGRRHELACAGCGAPLHDLKALPVKPHAPAAARRTPRPAPPRRAPQPAGPPRKRKRKRKRTSLLRKAMSEAIDLLDDIFD